MVSGTLVNERVWNQACSATKKRASVSPAILLDGFHASKTDQTYLLTTEASLHIISSALEHMPDYEANSLVTLSCDDF